MMRAIKPVKPGIRVGRPAVPVPEVKSQRERRAEVLDATTREGEDVAAYQRRVLRQINSLDWGDDREDDGPEL